MNEQEKNYRRIQDGVEALAAEKRARRAAAANPPTTATSAKHTPGPWKIQDEYDGTLPIDGWDDEAGASVEICRASLDILTEDDRLANARLIAAAPELLAALETLEAIASKPPIVGRRVPMDKAIAEARAAIAKARGQ